MDELVSCIIIRQQGFVYVVANKQPQKDNYFFDDYYNLHKCEEVIEGYRSIWLKDENNLQFETGAYTGIKWIVGTTNPKLNKEGVALCPNLYYKLDMIKVKMEKYGFYTILEGGVDLGQYGYLLRPILTQNGQIITSF